MEQIPGVPEVAEFVDDELSSLGEEADGKPSVFFGFESICVVSGGPSGLESPQTALCVRIVVASSIGHTHETGARNGIILS